MKISAKISANASFVLAIICVCLPACDKQEEHHHETAHKVVVTTPIAKDIVSTQEYVCQIHSSRHIEVRALESGYLEAIPVKEGQSVKQGDTMFRIVPTLYQAKLDAELAEAQLAQIELANTQRLYQQNVIAKPEVALAEAKLAKAQAKVALARAELNFATVKAPFDGIIDHQRNQQGSLIAEGDILTTLSDNSVMWVYFNVPERDYLKYMAAEDQSNLIIELELADGKKFSHPGKIGALEADFNNETGNIAFRADFPNPQGLLRHGQTGKILISRVMKNAIVIPQRATFEILAKRYVFIVTPAEKKPEMETNVEPEVEHVSANGFHQPSAVHPVAFYAPNQQQLNNQQQQPVPQQPQFQQAAQQPSGLRQTGVVQSGHQQPLAQQPTAQQPTAQQPTAQQPTAQQSTGQQSIAHQSGPQHPGPQQPGPQQPGPQQPAPQSTPQQPTHQHLSPQQAPQHAPSPELSGHPHAHEGEESSPGEVHNVLSGVVHQREIIILSERDDIYLIKDGVGVEDKIILEGIRQVRDGEEVEYEFIAPELALEHLKYHAE